MRGRVALGPLEVDVGRAAGRVADVQEQGREGVGDGGGLQGQDAVALVQDLAPDGEAGLELRGVQDGDLHEDEVLAGDVVVLADLLDLVAVLGLVA